MTASTSPFFTICPSLNSTCVSTPETCAATVTVASGVTVPSASRKTGMSSLRARATPTVLAPAAPAPARAPRAPGAPELPAALAPGGRPASAAGGRCVRYQARAPRAASASTAIVAPTQPRLAGSARGDGDAPEGEVEEASVEG